jgi:hypothetical protein
MRRLVVSLGRNLPRGPVLVGPPCGPCGGSRVGSPASRGRLSPGCVGVGRTLCVE